MLACLRDFAHRTDRRRLGRNGRRRIGALSRRAAGLRCLAHADHPLCKHQSSDDHDRRARCQSNAGTRDCLIGATKDGEERSLAWAEITCTADRHPIASARYRYCLVNSRLRCRRHQQLRLQADQLAGYHRPVRLPAKHRRPALALAAPRTGRGGRPARACSKFTLRRRTISRRKLSALLEPLRAEDRATPTRRLASLPCPSAYSQPSSPSGLGRLSHQPVHRA